MSHAFVSVC